MKIKQKILISVLIIILLLIILIFLLLKPLLAKTIKLSKIVEQQQIVIKNPDFQEQYQNQINQLKTDYEKIQPKLPLLKQALLEKAKAVEFIKILEKAAQKNNLQQNIQVLPEEKDGLNFNLFLTGVFPNFLRFLEYIENSQYLLKISSIKINKLHDSNQIQSNVQVKVYINQ